MDNNLAEMHSINVKRCVSTPRRHRDRYAGERCNTVYNSGHTWVSLEAMLTSKELLTDWVLFKNQHLVWKVHLVGGLKLKENVLGSGGFSFV